MDSALSSTAAPVTVLPPPEAAPQAPPPRDPPASRSGTGRLGWLDALRGLAALVVAVHHAMGEYTYPAREAMTEWFDPGAFGILVFFLVSGYIVPASLERTGDVRRFWVSRVFRIYPLLLVALTAMVLLSVSGVRPLGPHLAGTGPVAAVLAHLTMMQDLLSVPNAVYVLWTLSYEMAFYLLVVGLFSVGLHRRSASAALTLTALAIAVVGLARTRMLAEATGVTPLVVVAFVTMAAAITLACARRPALMRAGALLGAALAFTLATLDSRAATWEGLIILAVMFTGTAIYRAERGQIRWRTALLTAAAVLVSAVALGLYEKAAWGAGMTDWGVKRAWASAVVLAALVFAGGMLLRDRRMPGWLVWLGVVSYSVYILHPVLLEAMTHVFGKPVHQQPLVIVVFLGLLLAASQLTYRLVEKPMQELGRKVARRLG
ncbi:acyltransferase family protein [Actinomadura macrotermitis]|uniref:Acyltransferase 3 domain-containing protein n=1 Tax=Actinomadura macrotermitis TaxID=2585200 RepID=A0A7K0C4Y7_9ACTN|nr:acyltransferase [Actinomadura macrotermitis]MQY08503.1 hypothetical protein [Actinomadura macrotermitis]